MRDRAITKRYAEAYVSFASPTIGMPKILGEMQVLSGALHETPELLKFLEAPEASLDHKAAFLEKVFTGLLSAETLDFIKYLVLKKRVDRLFDITEYIRMAYAPGGMVDVVLRSTFPLEAQLTERIREAIGRRINRNVHFECEHDSDLLGGVRITIGNKIIDASVRSKLDELRKQLLKAQVA